MTRPTVDLTGTKILAVDDVPENLDVLVHTLEDTGYSPRGKPAAQVLRAWFAGLR